MIKCLPIVFGIDFNNDIPILFGSFCKFAYYSYVNKWPIIAQEQYFDTFEKYNKDFLKEVFDINEIGQVNDGMLSKLDCYKIDNNQTNKVIEEFHDREKAWISLMNVMSKSLYSTLDLYIEEILKKYKNVKTIIVWRHNHTITSLAKKYKLNVIEMELSALRKRTYEFGLSYFQFSKKYSDVELNKRYDKFANELSKSKKKIPFLTRKQIQNLILSEDKLKLLKHCEMYDFGIALGLNSDYETISSNSMKNEDMLKEILKIENPENILIRKHPLDANYKFDNEEKFSIDNSKSSIEFITKCHKIVSSVSNTNFEAMIFGKTCYTLGNMPFAKFSYKNLNYNDEYVINLFDLNFLIFCYYVPYSLCLNQEYINFRLSNPSEIDIYFKHYNYIMKKYGSNLNKDIVTTSIRERYIDTKEKIDDLKKSLEQSEIEKKNILISAEELNNQIKSMTNSKSWKLTEPFRKLARYIRREK